MLEEPDCCKPDAEGTNNLPFYKNNGTLLLLGYSALVLCAVGYALWRRHRQKKQDAGQVTKEQKSDD